MDDNALLNAVTFWVLNYVNLFTNNLKDKKNVAKLLLDFVGSGFWCIRWLGRRLPVPTAVAIWFSRALGRMSKGRELRSNGATWLKPEAFKSVPTVLCMARCGKSAMIFRRNRKIANCNEFRLGIQPQ